MAILMIECYHIELCENPACHLSTSPLPSFCSYGHVQVSPCHCWVEHGQKCFSLHHSYRAPPLRDFVPYMLLSPGKTQKNLQQGWPVRWANISRTNFTQNLSMLPGAPAHLSVNVIIIRKPYTVLKTRQKHIGACFLRVKKDMSRWEA